VAENKAGIKINKKSKPLSKVQKIILDQKALEKRITNLNDKENLEYVVWWTKHVQEGLKILNQNITDNIEQIEFKEEVKKDQDKIKKQRKSKTLKKIKESN